MGLVGVLWACVALVVCWWLVVCEGVSIIKGWENSKANPPKKRKKNLTRELKKPILALRGSEKFYEKGKKNFFINFS